MSIPFDVRDILAWTGGALAQGPAETRFHGVATDTRTLSEDALALFVAIAGERHDAHDHLGAALEAGARGLLVERLEPVPAHTRSQVPVIAVSDTTRALGDLAAGHRAGFDGPVIGITGSNGKTTTKEMAAAILEEMGPCLRTQGNLNNAYGLPRTLLLREPEHRVLVVELGTNHPGEIARLAEIAQPTVGVFANVGTAHVGLLGSREGIAIEKGALIEALPEDGVAVLNADDPLVLSQRSRTRARVLCFGLGADADVRAEEVQALGARGYGFRLVAPGGDVPVRVPGLGAPTVANALAAAAASIAAGATLEAVRRGLARTPQVGGRMRPLELASGVVVIDDTYNASPQSTEAALRSLADLRGDKAAVMVLGDMGELGSEAPPAHRAAGALAAELGIDAVIAQGDLAAEVASGALDAGMAPDRVRVTKDHDETRAGLGEVVHGDAWVLVKGSRAMRMERVVSALESRFAPGSVDTERGGTGNPGGGD